MASEFAGDVIDGIKGIANFTGLPERAVYYLASHGQLPGVFRTGRKWLGLKSEIEAGLRDRARNGASNIKGAR